ncbi:MAG: methylmalonyl-CoA epimerase [Candidatus Aegiribacteria sp.]|nr:methylmalonyl-CoA epimerase [Candidatus Aegiribacteria sp.]
MSVKGIDHIGIAVKNLEESMPFYMDDLGLTFLGIEEVPSQKVRVAMFSVGESRIELLEPTSEESPIAKAIEKRGQGVHHIAYSVESASGEIDSLKRKGIRMIDDTAREGAGGTRIAFIHPAASGKVLTELCEHPKAEKENQDEFS